MIQVYFKYKEGFIFASSRLASTRLEVDRINKASSRLQEFFKHTSRDIRLASRDLQACFKRSSNMLHKTPRLLELPSLDEGLVYSRGGIIWSNKSNSNVRENIL
jgi:hypothetical protein